MRIPLTVWVNWSIRECQKSEWPMFVPAPLSIHAVTNGFGHFDLGRPSSSCMWGKEPLMATGSRGADSSTALRTLIVNTKCSFVEHSDEGLVAFSLVTRFWRRSSLTLLATRFSVKVIFWVLPVRPKSGLSPMYERFEPPFSLLPRPHLEHFPEYLQSLQRVEMFFSALALNPGWFWKGQTSLVPWPSIHLCFPWQPKKSLECQGMLIGSIF